MNKKTFFRFLRFPLAYGIGFLAWLTGLYCVEVGPQDSIHLSRHKTWKHLLKVFIWTFGMTFLCSLPGIYSGWPVGVPNHEKITVILTLLILLLCMRFFWPSLFSFLLPGFHIFLCPQCYQRQSFKFLPVSFRYGFWVTYLCLHCSCLVNGWGEQVFYPSPVHFKKLVPCFIKTIPSVFLAIVLGMVCFQIVLKNI